MINVDHHNEDYFVSSSTILMNLGHELRPIKKNPTSPEDDWWVQSWNIVNKMNINDRNHPIKKKNDMNI